MRFSLSLAVRRLRRTPVFTVTAIGSLCLGTGLASSLAAVVEGALRPTLPYASPDRLVEILPTARPGSRAPSDFGIPAHLASQWIEAEIRTVAGLAGEGMAQPRTVLSADGSHRVDRRVVLGDWFGTLGVAARLGRVLDRADLRPDAPPALVASDRFWREQLSGAPNALGESITIADVTYVLVGILPRSYTSDAAVWVNHSGSDAPPAAYRMVARFGDGFTARDVGTELTRAVSRDDRVEGGVVAVPLMELSTAVDRSRLWILVGSVCAILLVGALNLTTLFLVRAQAKRADMAVRRSLGASTRDLVRETLEDSALLGLVGGGGGFLLAHWGRDLVHEFAGASTLHSATPGLGVAALLVAVTVPLLISGAVACQESRTLSRDPLRSVLQTRSGGSSGTARDRRVRHSFVALQVAGSVVLVVTGVMLGFAFQEYRGLDVGYDLDRAVLLVPDYEDGGVDRGGQWAAARRLSQHLSQREEIAGIGLIRITYQPFPPEPEAHLRIDLGSAGVETLQRRGAFYEVDPTFFDVTGVRLTRGRGFTQNDTEIAPAVAIVNDAAARTWWRGESPIGRQVQLGAAGEWLTVVGTVDATHRPSSIGRLVRAQGAVEEPLLFRPLAQSATLPPGWIGNVGCSDITGDCGAIHLFVQATNEPSHAMRVIQEEMESTKPMLEIAELQTIPDAHLGLIGQEIQLLNRMVTWAGAIGVVLGLLGIVGVVSDSVTRRTREIGVRMALGARAPQIISAMGREAVLTTVAGVGIGLVSLFALSENLVRVPFLELVISRWQLASGLLSPVPLLTGIGSLLLIVFVATALTALRALQVDPAVTLRAE